MSSKWPRKKTMYILQNVLLVISMQLLEKTLKFEFTHLTLNICRIYVEILKSKKYIGKIFFKIFHTKKCQQLTPAKLFFICDIVSNVIPADICTVNSYKNLNFFPT